MSESNTGTINYVTPSFTLHAHSRKAIYVSIVFFYETLNNGVLRRSEGGRVYRVNVIVFLCLRTIRTILVRIFTGNSYDVVKGKKEITSFRFRIDVRKYYTYIYIIRESRHF